MPGSVFGNSPYNKGFSGYIAYTLDDGVGASTYELPADDFAFNPSENTSRPLPIDGSSLVVNKVLGLKTGPIRQSGPVRADRGMAAMFSSAFGQRIGGKLLPWFVSVSEFSGATPYVAAGLWFRSFMLSGAVAVRGQDAQMRYQLDGMVLDPDNVSALTAAALPVGGGTNGAGISSFDNVSVDNNGTAVYDGLRAIQLEGNNGMDVDPSVKDIVNRLAAGMTPMPLTGQFLLRQMKGAANPLPQANGEYPMRIKIPTGDGTHTMTVLVTASYDSRSQNVRPNDYTERACVYQLTGAAPGSTTTTALFAYA